MALQVACPMCRVVLKLSDELVGKQIRCTQCKHVFKTAERKPAAPKIVLKPAAPAPVAKPIHPRPQQEVGTVDAILDEQAMHGRPANMPPLPSHRRTAPLNVDGKLTNIVMGSASDGPLLVTAGERFRGSTTFWDVKTFRALPLQAARRGFGAFAESKP